MTNSEIKKRLNDLSENNYKDFSSSLIPNCEKMYGVRIPKLRQLAKEIAKGDWKEYLTHASDESFEEISLQAFVLGYAKADIEELLGFAANFIPKITNWSVNDSFCSTFKITTKHRERVWEFLMAYRNSEKEFEQRVVAVMLMNYYLIEEYIDQVLEVWDNLKHDGYYLKMGVAWGLATAYAKFPEKTHEYLLNNHLNDFTYNKAIQKMMESYRVPTEDKEKLKVMKRK